MQFECIFSWGFETPSGNQQNFTNLALSVFASQIHLSQRERPWHSGKVSGQRIKFPVSPEALPLGELAKPTGFD